jgi:signal transduction histidine kinase
VGELLDPSRLGADGQLPAAELTQTVGQVTQEVLQVTAQTEQKMAALEQKIVEFMQPAPAGMSAAARTRRDVEARKAVFAMLAEIVQELCQPLSVVHSTVDMIKGGYLGAVTETQVEMLNLASSSADRMKHLVDKLTEIAGFPAGTKPDADILKAVYEK